LDALPSRERPILSDISLWEAAMLVAGGRLTLEDDLEQWLLVAASPATVQLARLSSEVVARMNRLPASFHRDPADRLIVSTAIMLDRPLFTYDRKIIDSGIVPIWRTQ
ncbi:MAG TPA: type II toxin-antitoxin system VapC family toxin, partial [Oceanipulchritudo sp.]|nr:type II toxin-antitoxin system VapC family toxin [Oceanipulchritudo sp.]